MLANCKIYCPDVPAGRNPEPMRRTERIKEGYPMAFDVKRHLIKVQRGQEYLPVSARLIWFRQEHPDWGIVTTPVEINHEKQYAIFTAQIFNAEGKLMATAHKKEDVKGFPDYLEKAETGSVGRALAYCGYGTQFAPELEEGGRLADSPYGGGRFTTRPNTPAVTGRPGGPAPANGGYTNGGGYNNGGGYSGANVRPVSDGRPVDGPRPVPAGNGNNGEGERPVATLNRPAMPAPPSDTDEPFDDEPELAPRPAVTRPAATAPPATAPTPRSTAPAPAPAQAEAARPAPAANGNGITRVREPEREYDEPGEEDDDKDPFEDEEESSAPPPARGAAPQAATRPTPPKPAPANEADDVEAKTAKPAPTTALGAKRCTVPGCTTDLTPGQITMSLRKYGRLVCPAHQKDVAPLDAENRQPAAGLL